MNKFKLLLVFGIGLSILTLLSFKTKSEKYPCHPNGNLYPCSHLCY